MEVTSSIAFGPTNLPLAGGLYDTRMGPTQESDPPCDTCALKASLCPGHFGHLECAFPVHHPLLLPEILHLLRSKCLACHRLKAAPRQMAVARAKFWLLARHELSLLHGLDEALEVAVREARGEGDKASTVAVALAMDAALKEYQPTPTAVAKYEASSSRSSLNSYERKLRKQLIAECLNLCKSAKKCAHCAAYSPKIRADSSNKVFQAHLSGTHSRANAGEGIRIRAAMDERGYDSDDGSGGGQADMDVDEENDSGDSDSGDDSDSNEETKKGGKDDNDEEDMAVSKDLYMTTWEVKAQLKRTWEADPFMMNALFGAGGSFEPDTYRIYFLQAIPVPPNRFRPPMKLGGMVVQHSQTNYLAAILQQNELLRTHWAADRKSRAYEAWIELQTQVNCLMDSSKDPSATPANLVSPGIKQILERKEGLFRKNMMGKRVDFACRSVISPDPYLGTNEIGIPRYFATVLTYPTPVTDMNIKEMRQLVERGPKNYPGARWVEMQGRRFDLGKMPNKARREAMAAQLLTHLKKSGQPAIVGRQLRDGDYVLMNRQVCTCLVYVR